MLSATIGRRDDYIMKAGTSIIRLGGIRSACIDVKEVEKTPVDSIPFNRLPFQSSNYEEIKQPLLKRIIAFFYNPILMRRKKKRESKYDPSIYKALQELDIVDNRQDAETYRKNIYGE